MIRAPLVLASLYSAQSETYMSFICLCSSRPRSNSIGYLLMRKYLANKFFDNALSCLSFIIICFYAIQPPFLKIVSLSNRFYILEYDTTPHLIGLRAYL